MGGRGLRVARLRLRPSPRLCMIHELTQYKVVSFPLTRASIRPVFPCVSNVISLVLNFGIFGSRQPCEESAQPADTEGGSHLVRGMPIVHVIGCRRDAGIHL